jgi:hypothetical protein
MKTWNYDLDSIRKSPRQYADVDIVVAIAEALEIVLTELETLNDDYQYKNEFDSTWQRSQDVINYYRQGKEDETR